MTAVIGMCAVLALWFGLAYCYRGPSWPKSVIKTASVAGLSLAAFWAGAPPMLGLALGLGALGDFCLSRAGKPAFLAGLVAFALAHLAYAVLLHQSGAVAALTPAVGLMLLLAAGMGLVLFAHAGPLRWPVVGYVAIIAGMAVLALGLPPVLWLGVVAALCFVLSDAVLGLELFVLGPAHPLRRVTPFVVWGAYWTAQLLFLLAFGGVWPL